jgi:hypothetical protein
VLILAATSALASRCPVAAARQPAQHTHPPTHLHATQPPPQHTQHPPPPTCGMSLKAGRASPKSQILSLQSELARMFLGLRSRWNTCTGGGSAGAEQARGQGRAGEGAV